MDARVGALAGLHVLVVEDNRDARQIFTALLTHFGAFVTTVETARAALRQLRALKPDVVLADIQLPDHSGSWLLSRVRGRGLDVPFIAISGADFDEAQLAASGFEAFLRKPVEHARLVEAILQVARRTR